MVQKMNKQKTVFEVGYQISLFPVLVALILLGVALFIVGEIFSYPNTTLEYSLFSLYILAFCTWLLWRWQPSSGHWMMIPILLNGVYIAKLWLGVPGFLVFAAFPVILTVPLIGIQAATITALIETISIVLFLQWLRPEINSTEIRTAVFAIWIMLGIVRLIYFPINNLRDWVKIYFEKEQEQLEANRNRRLERAQMIEDLAQANLHLNRLNQLAQNLQRNAEEARRVKEEFVANVSHELRTPLNMITGFSETILQAPELYGDAIPSMLLSDLSVIHRNAEHLSNLIDDILDLSQIDAEQMALTKEDVQFTKIIEDAVIAVSPLFNSKGLFLKVETEEHLPFVHCDRTRIQEVFLNLLSNAGRFTEKGGVQIKVWHEDNMLFVSFEDTGPGIAAKDMDKLFEPFQQIDGSLRRRYGGTGLGLSISKRFIELHMGKIWVESKENVGTIISFQLPINPPLSLIEENDFLYGITPGWEFRQRTRPSKVPKQIVNPRFVLLETTGSMHRLLTRYQDNVEIVQSKDLEEALIATQDIPTLALLLNEDSVPRRLTNFDPSRLPDGTPAIIFSMPEEQESAELLKTTTRLFKPISQKVLLSTLDKLGVTEGTILIVDDEPDALQLFGRMLAASGQDFRVLLARDGLEALDILRVNQVQAILLDLIMPRMNGFQFLEHKNNNPILRQIPAIILSALDSTGQPIVSDAIAVTQNGGFSARQLLIIIESLSQALSAAGQNDDPMLTKASSD